MTIRECDCNPHWFRCCHHRGYIVQLGPIPTPPAWGIDGHMVEWFGPMGDPDYRAEQHCCPTREHGEAAFEFIVRECLLKGHEPDPIWSSGWEALPTLLPLIPAGVPALYRA